MTYEDAARREWEDSYEAAIWNERLQQQKMEAAGRIIASPWLLSNWLADHEDEMEAAVMDKAIRVQGQWHTPLDALLLACANADAASREVTLVDCREWLRSLIARA